MSADEFAFQVAVWGYADWLPAPYDAGAAASELRDAAWFRVPLWDRDVKSLWGQSIGGVPPPLWWTLPWVTEQLMRAEMSA